jgi:hypothetical protein
MRLVSPFRKEFIIQDMNSHGAGQDNIVGSGKDNMEAFKLNNATG